MMAEIECGRVCINRSPSIPARTVKGMGLVILMDAHFAKCPFYAQANGVQQKKTAA